MKYSRSNLCVLTLAAGLVLVTPATGQTVPDEHAPHHPKPGAADPADAGKAGRVAPGSTGAGMGEMGKPTGTPPQPDAAKPAADGTAAGAAPAGGMAGGMGAMMDGMMGPKSSPGGCMGGNCGSGAGTTPIYPSLMTLPALTPEKRAELDALAIQQTKEGTERLAKGSESLDRATRAGDAAAMQQAVDMMHEALDELEAGISARRVLSEGKAPRNLALDWFKREMSLASPIARDQPRASSLHLFAMALLIAFAFAMLAMYFFRMRRAAALFGRLEPDPASPPPGSSPPLGGARQ